MKLEQSFTVAAPVEQVWAALVDVERVAPCLPGAEITGREDDGSYTGNFTVKLGPTTAAYAGHLEVESVDEESRTTTMSARGSDRRGQGSANATIVSRVTEQAGGTRVDVSTDFAITGRLARFGRAGMMDDISQRLLREFADCLQSRLEGAPAEAAGPAVVPPPVTSGDVPAEAAGGEPASADPGRVGTLGVPAPAEPGRQPVGATGGAAQDDAAEPPDRDPEPELTPTPTPPPDAVSPSPPPPAGDAQGRVGTSGGGGAPPAPVTGPPPPPGGRRRHSEPEAEPEPEPVAAEAPPPPPLPADVAPPPLTGAPVTPEPEPKPEPEPEPAAEAPPARPPGGEYLTQAPLPEEPAVRTESIPPPGRETPPAPPPKRSSGGPLGALKRLFSRRK